MFWIFGLDEYLSATVAATRATGDLHDGLCEAFGGAKVGAEETLIGIEYHDQRNVGEVVTFGDHLRANENAGITACDARDDRFELVLTTYDIAIEPCDADALEGFGEALLDAFSTLAYRFDGVAALRALARQFAIGTAVMTT